MHFSICAWFLNVSLRESGTVPEQSHKHRKSSVTIAVVHAWGCRPIR